MSIASFAVVVRGMRAEGYRRIELAGDTQGYAGPEAHFVPWNGTNDRANKSRSVPFRSIRRVKTRP